MNLVDSSGWLENLTDDKNAKIFAPLIEYLNKLIVSTINIFKVYKKVSQNKGEDDAILVAGLMNQATVVDVNRQIALYGAKISFEKNIPMADSIIYATGILNEAVVWTQDFDFKDLKGVKYFKK